MRKEKVSLGAIAGSRKQALEAKASQRRRIQAPREYDRIDNGFVRLPCWVMKCHPMGFALERMASECRTVAWFLQRK